MTTEPAVGRSMAPSMSSSVVLPLPDGPMISTTSPAVDVEIHVAHGGDGEVAVAEDLGEAADLDGGGRGRVVVMTASGRRMAGSTVRTRRRGTAAATSTDDELRPTAVRTTELGSMTTRTFGVSAPTAAPRVGERATRRPEWPAATVQAAWAATVAAEPQRAWRPSP